MTVSHSLSRTKITETKSHEDASVGTEGWTCDCRLSKEANKTATEEDLEALKDIIASNQTTIAMQTEDLEQQKILNAELRHKISRLEMKILDLGETSILPHTTDDRSYFRIVKLEQMMEKVLDKLDTLQAVGSSLKPQTQQTPESGVNKEKKTIKPTV